MRKRKSFVSLLITTLTVFVLSLCAGIIFSFNPVTANAVWTADGGVDHYTDMTSNGEDLEYYDTLYNEDWTLYNSANQSLGAMPKEWTIVDDQYVRFTPSASNTTGSFVWKFSYTCTTASTEMYIYPLSSGAWNGAEPFDFGSCGFEAGNTYEVELGVVKVKNNSNYFVFVTVNGVFKIGTYRAETAKQGNDLYFYIKGGAGTLVSEKPIEYEEYDTLYNADFGLSGSWSLKDETYVSFTPSAENTTGSFVWAFEYACTAAGTINIYPLAGGSWPNNGNSTVFNLNACDFTAGNTYEVELGILKIKNSSNYQIYVTVNGEEKINVTRDESLKQGNGLFFYVIGAAGTLVSEKPIEYEEYQVIQNDDLGIAGSYTAPSADATNGIGFTNELATASFVYKFQFTPASGDAIVYLRSSFWGGNSNLICLFRGTNIVYEVDGVNNAVNDVFVIGEKYTVELGAIDIKDSDNTWIFIKVDGNIVFSKIVSEADQVKGVSFYGSSAAVFAQYSWTVNFNGEKKEVINGQAIGVLPQAPAQEGEIFVGWTDQNGNTVTESTVPTSNLTLTANYRTDVDSSEYADYVSVQNDDMGMENPQETTGDGSPFGYTPIANGNNSVVYTYTYANSMPTATHAVVLQGNDWTSNGYAFFMEATQIIIGAAGTGNAKSVSVTYGIGDKIELGAINYANEAKVLLYVKINDVWIGDDTVASRNTAAGIFTWNAAYVAQYSYSVTFTGVETREVIVGNTVGTLPDAPANENEFLGWFDQDGNEVTASTVPNEDLTVTAVFAEPHNVTFTVDGEVYKTYENVAYNSAIGTLPTAPDKASYVFNGWFDQGGNKVTAETVVTKNMTVTAQYVETETYDILDNADWGLAEEWTTADVFLQFTPSSENTTGSFVWKFDYTAKQTTGGLHIYPLSAAAWRGANPVNLNAISWTADETYKVEFGVVKLKDSSNYSVFINVNGERKYDGTDTIQHNSNCTNAGCTEDAAHLNGIHFYVAGGSGVIQGKPLEYETYKTVQNVDLGLEEEMVLAAGSETTKAFTGDATNGSVAYKFYIDVADTYATTFQIQLRGEFWKGYAFNMAESFIQIVHNEQNYGHVAMDARLTDCLMEIGAIDVKGTNKVHLYWKVNGEEKISLLIDKVADFKNNSVFIYTTQEVTLSQYSYTVNFGTETKEVFVGDAVGELPAPTDAPVNGYTFDKWVDQAGNEITSDTVLNGNCVATPQYVYHYTIKNEEGNVISSGAHIYGTELAYDGNTLTDANNAFVGYYVGETLYQNLDDALAESAETDTAMVAKTVGLGLIDGASIRLSSTNASIRFTSAISIADSEKVLDFGILLTTEEVRQTLSEFTIEGLNGVDSSLYYNYNKNSGKLRYVENKDYANQYVYSLVLEKVSKANYGVKYTARAYVLVEYADGTTAYIYNKFNEVEHIRSMYDVANMAIVDAEANYTDSQKTIIQKYIDGVIALDENLELTGEARNYTVSVSGMDVDGAYTITVTPKNGFAISGIGAIYVEGEKIPVYEANAAAGTFKIKEADMNANTLAAFNLAMEKANDVSALQISAYSGPSLGVKQTAEDTIVAGGYVATYEDLKTYMEAGFDAWYVEVPCLSSVTGYTAKGTPYQGDAPTYDVYRALDLAAQYANETGKPCPVYINIPHLTGMSMSIKEEAGKTWIKFIYDIFTNYNDGVTTAENSPVNGINQIGGFMLRDEPTIDDYNAFAAVFNEIAYNCGAIAAGYDFTCALFQTYAGSESVGSSYAEYVNKYATLMKDTRISFDNYPFYYVSKDGWYSSTSENRMEGSWYSDMQAVRANANGKGTCIQSFTAGAEESGWFTKTTKYKMIDKEAEISMQVYTALAYGFTELDYFVYWDTMNRAMQEANENTGEVFQKTPIMWNDTSDWSKGHYQTDYYDWIKNTNTEAKSLFEVLSKFTSTGVQLVEGSLACANTFGNASTTNTTNAITASAAYDMVIGGFMADGYNGYLAVNVDFPDTDGTRTNAVTFTLGTQYSKAIVYVDGEATVVRVAKDGTLNLNIGCGEGVFIVPIA